MVFYDGFDLLAGFWRAMGRWEVRDGLHIGRLTHGARDEGLV